MTHCLQEKLRSKSPALLGLIDHSKMLMSMIIEHPKSFKKSFLCETIFMETLERWSIIVVIMNFCEYFVRVLTIYSSVGDSRRLIKLDIFYLLLVQMILNLTKNRDLVCNIWLLHKKCKPQLFLWIGKQQESYAIFADINSCFLFEIFMK